MSSASSVRFAAIAVLSLTFLLACARTPAPAPQPATTLIRGARVFDGTGAPARSVSVRIAGDRIAAVGDLVVRPEDRVVDADGLVLAPGFIDTHSHHGRALLEQPDALGAVSQGVTTIVEGVDGGSWHPLADWFRELEDTGVAVNVASFSGHGTLREKVMGDDYRRAATPAEVDSMRVLLRRDMEGGALGLSTGLEYDPGIYSTTEEVIELAREASRAGGRYSSHMRSEDRRLMAAVDEIIRIGREAGIPVQISHMKLAMKSLWGRADELLARLDAARADGVDITADVYPYTFWQSTMTVLFPDRDFTDREAAAFALQELAPPEGMLVARYEPEPAYEGMTLADVASERGQDPVTTYMELIARVEAEDAEESIIATSMDRSDVVELFQWPHTNVCSDGGLDGAHPRGFGAFTRVLGPYVRAGHLTLADAVHKMTGLSATHLGIEDRGVIQAGAFADLVLFDPDSVSDRATPEAPHAVSVGIRSVWVNGKVVFREGTTTDARSGRVVRRPVATAVPAPEQAAGGVPSPAIDSVFADYDRGDVPGCAVGVMRQGRLAFARGYGMADLEHGVPLSSRSVFRIGSVSKQFTAAAAVLLAQDGAIDLDEPVRSYLPELPDYGPEFTVRRLLTHTSGVRDYLVLMDLAGLRGADFYTDADVMEMLARQPVTNFEPGAEFLYSNSGYFLLSQIVERVTGRTLAEFARDRLFGPLGMRDTHFHADHSRIVPHRADGYAPAAWADGSDETAATGWRISTTRLPMIGDGGVFTTIEDLARWDANFDDPAVGGASFPQTMLRRGVLTSGDTTSYALGLEVGTHRGLPVVAHGGAFVGYRAASLRYPGPGVSVYTLCNRADANPSRLSRGVGEVLLGDRMEPVVDSSGQATPGDEGRVDTLAATAPELRPFTGTYHSEVLDASYRVRLDGGTLVLDVGNRLDGPMAMVGEDTFQARRLELRFHRDDAGRVTGFEVDAGRVRGIGFRRVERDPSRMDRGGG